MRWQCLGMFWSAREFISGCLKLLTLCEIRTHFCWPIEDLSESKLLIWRAPRRLPGSPRPRRPRAGTACAGARRPRRGLRDAPVAPRFLMPDGASVYLKESQTIFKIWNICSTLNPQPFSCFQSFQPNVSLMLTFKTTCWHYFEIIWWSWHQYWNRVETVWNFTKFVLKWGK